jgi:hypothetical protein
MRATPPIPDVIRGFSIAGYRNIYELCPRETRLFGAESLYGNWDGELLLLAKDFAPASLIEDRTRAGDPRPFRHTDWTAEKAVGARTNKRLDRMAAPVARGRKLYGSALGGLLRDDKRCSGALPNPVAVREYVRHVMDFTLANMPHLRVIACLGVEAWDAVTVALGEPNADRSRHRQADTPLPCGRIQVFALGHPRADTNRAMEASWAAIRTALAS